MRDRPSPNHKLEWPGGVVPEWARPQSKRARRGGKGQRGGKGGGGGKRERLSGRARRRARRVAQLLLKPRVCGVGYPFWVSQSCWRSRQ